MLKTGWVVIGTSGMSIDGRPIPAETLETMAAAYDAEEYTAVINADHDLEWYGSYGHVVALRTGKDKKGRVTLEAQLAPNARLIEMNRNGQRMFTSMEIWDNYADTNTPYLCGLAVTDNPASLGTTMLKFSRRPNKEQQFTLSETVAFDLNLPKPESKPEPKSDHSLQAFIAACREFFTAEPPQPAPPQREDHMTKEEFEAFLAAQKQQMQAIMDKLDALSVPAEPEAAEEPEQDAVAELAEKFAALEAEHKELQQKYTALTTEVPPTPVPEQEGTVTEFI